MEKNQFIDIINNLKECAAGTGTKVTRQDVIREFGNKEFDEAQIDMIMAYFAEKENEEIAEPESENVEISEEKLASIKVEDDKFKIEYLRDLSQSIENCKLLADMDEDEKRDFIDSFDPQSNKLLLAVYDWSLDFELRGVLLADLVAEGNLIAFEASQSIVGIGRNVYEKLQEVVTSHLDEMVSKEGMDISGQQKALEKVNLVQNCATQLSQELNRKVTSQEIAEKLSWTNEAVLEILDYTANKIEKVVYENDKQ